MGCNTSKESVQPAVDEAKEGDSVKNGGESAAFLAKRSNSSVSFPALFSLFPFSPFIPSTLVRPFARKLKLPELIRRSQSVAAFACIELFILGNNGSPLFRE